MLVLVHGHHFPPAGQQPLDHPGADRAQPDDDHVPAQPGDPLPAEGFLETAADDHVGEHGEEDGDEQRAEQHQADRQHHQQGRLAAEGEIAVTDGRYGLDREVGRVEDRDRSRLRQPVRQVQDRGGGEEDSDQRDEGGSHPPVRGRVQQRDRDVPEPPPRAERPGVRGVTNLPGDPGGAQFLGRGEHRDVIALVHGVIAAGADHDVPAGRGQHGYRRQRPVQFP